MQETENFQADIFFYVLKSKPKGAQKQRSLLISNKPSVCCIQWPWSEPTYSSFQNDSATLELQDIFTS